MEQTNKDKVLKRLDSAEQAIKEARDFVFESETAIQRVAGVLEDFAARIGITNKEPTADELERKVTELQEKTAEKAIDETVAATAKVAEVKAEEIKAAQPEDAAKVAVNKTKDEVVAKVKEVASDKKEEIKKSAIDIAV